MSDEPTYPTLHGSSLSSFYLSIHALMGFENRTPHVVIWVRSGMLKAHKLEEYSLLLISKFKQFLAWRTELNVCSKYLSQRHIWAKSNLIMVLGFSYAVFKPWSGARFSAKVPETTFFENFFLSFLLWGEVGGCLLLHDLYLSSTSTSTSISTYTSISLLCWPTYQCMDHISSEKFQEKVKFRSAAILRRTRMGWRKKKPFEDSKVKLRSRSRLGCDFPARSKWMSSLSKKSIVCPSDSFQITVKSHG